MMRKIFITTLLLFLLINSAYAATRYSGVPQNPYISKQLKLPYFQSIQTYGDMDLQIDGGSYRQTVGISGRRKTLQSTRMYVKGKTLYIVTLARSQMASRAKIQIVAPRLNQLNCSGGSGNIRIEHISPARPFGMDIYGNSNVSLNGNIRLRNVMVGGNTKLWVYWVNSCDCSLNAMGNAKISVAGIATTLEINAFQNARIDARYLRTKRAFIKSYGNSRVDLQAMCSLNAFASGCSTIYYYEDPRFQAPYMLRGGSVVGMTHVCCPPCDLCDRACCKNGWH